MALRAKPEFRMVFARKAVTEGNQTYELGWILEEERGRAKGLLAWQQIIRLQ
jgi:hypothetical protein